MGEEADVEGATSSFYGVTLTTRNRYSASSTHATPRDESELGFEKLVANCTKCHPFLTTFNTVPGTHIMAPFRDYILYSTRYTHHGTVSCHILYSTRYTHHGTVS